MSTINLRVNGTAHTVDVEPSTPLLYILRNDLGLQGPRFGCGLGQCGACTVIINGVATRSCVTPTSTVRGEITTLEGLSMGGNLHPIQQAWIEEQVPQCGFCQNGQIMTAKALLDKNPNPTDAQIREGMARTLCRCMTYLSRSAGHQARGQGGRMTSFDRHSQTHRRPAGRTEPRHLAPRLLESVRRPGGDPRSGGGGESATGARADRWSLSRSGFQAARLVDRHSPGQHRDVLRREDGLRPGHRHGLPPDDGRRARSRIRPDDLHHGEHR